MDWPKGNTSGGIEWATCLQRKSQTALFMWMSLILLVLGRLCGGEPSDKPHPNLIELAVEKFGSLRPADEELFQKLIHGKLADYRAETEKDNDPAKADEWSPDRILYADRIEWLFTDRRASRLLTHCGIWVNGAYIKGNIDLSFAQASIPLRFENCRFSGNVSLAQARVYALDFSGTHLHSMNCNGIKVERDVVLSGGFQAQDGVHLLNATIGGNLDCEDAKFTTDKGSDALSADGVKVERDVILKGHFSAEGAVHLAGATIGGNLDCEKARLINKGLDALNADGASVAGDVILRHGFKAEGEVRLIGATIGGNLDCENAQFINRDADALCADSARIEDNVFLCNGFKAEGEVRLIHADIGGNLECEGGQFINPRKDSLTAQNMEVRGNAFLCDGFVSKGKVSLASATIAGDFVWTAITAPREATLDLRSAKIGTFLDDRESWPEEGRLFLHGLVYDEIHNIAPRDAESRLKWLQLQEGFWPRAYEQLAKVLSQSGQDVEAQKILIAKNKDKARFTKLTLREWLWYRLFGPMIAYGYEPWRALWIGLVLVLLGWLFFWAGYRANVMTPANEKADGSGGFSALVYSIDVFVPLVDLRQASYWLPDANRCGKVGISNNLNIAVNGRLLRYYFWFQIIAGWALTTLLVVGVTGLVRT